jgi:predicted DNA-binding transcriptional regulator YafY
MEYNDIAIRSILLRNMGRHTQAWPESWDVLLRYHLIEIIAYWEGRLTTTHLQNAFGIGRQQASQNIQHYIEQTAPDSLIYNKYLKGYQPGPSFKPRYTQGNVDEYLDLLIQQKHLSACFATLNLWLPNTDTIVPTMRNVRPAVLQKIIRACRESSRLEIDYASMSNPEPETRVIQPHTLVYTGYRWHTRAWCEKSREFRDFVLTRIFNTPDLLTDADKNMLDDSVWHTQVTLELIADPRLSTAQKKLVAHDYGFTDGVLKIPTRAALVTYYLQFYRIHPDDTERSATAQQIVLRNHEELAKWFF